MTESNRPITFTQLLSERSRVEVPLIQRDYAQGREAEKEVRDHFLRALYGALVTPVADSASPLNLDFVYGSMEGGDTPSFLPLDGQQRLTTLFLVHWYLAWRDGRLSEFQAMAWDGKHSRFTYSVRPSSTEFFDALVNYLPACSPEEVTSMRSLLENQPWFFLHWRLDPTIQSALVMLDAIHELFVNTSGLYARLVDHGQPAITFQLLPLEHFGLTDDLYIKMNARGKPLTIFETFKARFEELLKELFPDERRKLGDGETTVASFFERRMDTQWTDFFWAYKNPRTHTFDDAVMNLFLSVARVSLDPSSTAFNEDATLLRNRPAGIGFSLFHERGWLTRTFTENLIELLEAWSRNHGQLASVLADTQHFDEVAFFRKAIGGTVTLEYSELVHFAALVFYLRHHNGNVDEIALKEWARVISNLVNNSDIERPEEFARALAGLHQLVKSSNRILERLASNKVSQIGFAQHQVSEEIIKARLILAHPGWRPRIETAEAHGYFRGQIEFLLAFCGVTTETKPVSQWDESMHAKFHDSFDYYARKALLAFTSSGVAMLSEHPHVWQRALLVTGDYLVQVGSNHSFLTNPPRNSDSWKRFLRGGYTYHRDYLKSLWDLLDDNAPIGPQLDAIIDSATELEPWIQAAAKHPEVIEYCGQREIRWISEDLVYLLRKRQMNGAHAELFSYALHQELATDSARIEISPLSLSEYYSVTMTEFEPCVILDFKSSSERVQFAIETREKEFLIQLRWAKIGQSPKVESVLRRLLGFTERNRTLARSVTREEIHDVLRDIARQLAPLAKTTKAPK